jgi:hypothetical protein
LIKIFSVKQQKKVSKETNEVKVERTRRYEKANPYSSLSGNELVESPRGTHRQLNGAEDVVARY